MLFLVGGQTGGKSFARQTPPYRWVVNCATRSPFSCREGETSIDSWSIFSFVEKKYEIIGDACRSRTMDAETKKETGVRFFASVNGGWSRKGPAVSLRADGRARRRNARKSSEEGKSLIGVSRGACFLLALEVSSCAISSTMFRDRSLFSRLLVAYIRIERCPKAGTTPRSRSFLVRSCPRDFPGISRLR